MKKSLLITMLAILTVMAMIPLAALSVQATGLSTDPSDFICEQCGNPGDGWFPFASEGKDMHAPYCEECYVFVGEYEEVCTPAEGTATCLIPARCSVCNTPMTESQSPDPDAHKWSDWISESSERHYRICENRCGTVEFEEHVDDGSCQYNCEVCGQFCEDPEGEHIVMTDWLAVDEVQHTRTCEECGGNQEFADHTDGDKDHKCDICTRTLGECADGDKDHKCDICTKTLGECADGDKSGKCDLCGTDMPTAPDKTANTGKDGKASDDSPTGIIITVVTLCVIAIGGAVAFVIIRKKRISL